MIKITVNGKAKGRYEKDKLQIGNSRVFSDVRLCWLTKHHITLHLNEIDFSVEVHGEQSFEYGGYSYYRDSGLIAVQYGETFKIGYNCNRGRQEDFRFDRAYTIRVVKRS